ncbi:alpha/beta fold hydrolase [Cupriavidus basilensis]
MCLGGLWPWHWPSAASTARAGWWLWPRRCISTAGLPPGTARCGTWSTTSPRCPRACGWRKTNRSASRTTWCAPSSRPSSSAATTSTTAGCRWPASARSTWLRGWVLRGAHRIACPTLVVNAREDELTSLRSADFLDSAVPDVRKVVVENSYHMICVDNDREQVVSSVLEFLGFDPAQARRPSRARVEVPMSEEAVAAVVNEYLQALTSGHFEAIFPLLEPGVRWRHHGEHPLAGSYDDRDAVIGMFARLQALAGKSVRIAVTAPPRIEGSTAEIDLEAASVMDGEARHSQGTQTLRMRNGRISAVTFRPSDSTVAAAEALPAPAG